jgi:hypothetical protein
MPFPASFSLAEGNTTSGVFVTLLDINQSGIINWIIAQNTTNNNEIRITIDGITETITLTGTSINQIALNYDSTIANIFQFYTASVYVEKPIYFKSHFKFEYRTTVGTKINAKILYGLF